MPLRPCEINEMILVLFLLWNPTFEVVLGLSVSLINLIILFSKRSMCLRLAVFSWIPSITFPLNNVILLFNFPPIILILAFLSLVFNSISITLLIPIIYPPPMSILLLVNGPPVMYRSYLIDGWYLMLFIIGYTTHGINANRTIIDNLLTICHILVSLWTMTEWTILP